jgi:hypothetical protein
MKNPRTCLGLVTVIICCSLGDAEELLLVSKLLLCYFNGSFDHIPCIFRSYAAPAFFLNDIIETKLFSQFRFHFIRHNSPSSTHSDNSSLTVTGIVLSEKAFIIHGKSTRVFQIKVNKKAVNQRSLPLILILACLRKM